MSLVPRPPSLPSHLIPSDLAEQTVTVPLLDLYDLLMRKERPMTEPKTKATKRGYRRVSMLLPVQEYDLIARMAEREERTPDQQATHMVRQLLRELHVEAIRTAYTEAVDRREAQGGDNGMPEETVDPHGIELGEVTRTE